MPIAAVTGRAEIMDAPGAGRSGRHICGQSAFLRGCARRARHVRAAKICWPAPTNWANSFRSGRGEWQKQWPIVGDVRGLGGMCAIELVRSTDTREPAAEETKKITQYCYEHGLITITAGTYSNVIRMLVPLVVTDAADWTKAWMCWKPRCRWCMTRRKRTLSPSLCRCAGRV